MPRHVKVIQEPKSGSSSGRALFVAFALVVWMLAIGARLVQVQIHQHDDLAARAQNQQLGAGGEVVMLMNLNLNEAGADGQHPNNQRKGNKQRAAAGTAGFGLLDDFDVTGHLTTPAEAAKFKI